MTNEQAIQAIKEHCYFANLVPIGKEALDMAIKALEQQPSEDCVSRQAVTEYLKKLLDGRFNASMSAAIMGIKDYINVMPSATPTLKTGHWIYEPNCWLRCSECGEHYPHTSLYETKGSNYCPNCGARMSEVEND